MSFRETLKTVVNHEDIDAIEGGIELDAENPAVLDQIEAMEDEVALVEAENALEGDIKGMEDGEVLAETADEEVAAAEEVIAEADAKAAESGEAPVVPVEDVVASQEALKTLVKQSGIEYEGIYASREDLYSNSYATYTSNLEGLKEIGGKIKEGLKKIWEKIVAGFQWIVEQIKKVLPTKLNRIKWIIGSLKKVKGNKVDSAKVAMASKAFTEKYGTKFAAVAKLVGTDLNKVGEFTKAIESVLTNIQSSLTQVKGKKGGEDAKIAFEPFGKLEDIENSFSGDIKTMLAEAKTAGYKITAFAPKGNTIKVTSISKGTDDTYTTEVNTINVSGFTAPTFKVDTALTGLADILKGANSVALSSQALNVKVKELAKWLAKIENDGALAGWVAGKKLEIGLRRNIMATMSCATSFDSGVIAYGLAYAQTLLKLYKGGQASDE